MGISNTNTNNEFRVPAEIKDGVLCQVNSIEKNSNLNVPDF